MAKHIFTSTLSKVSAILLITAVVGASACSGDDAGGANEGEPPVIGLLQVDDMVDFRTF